MIGERIHLAFRFVAIDFNQMVADEMAADHIRGKCPLQEIDILRCLTVEVPAVIVRAVAGVERAQQGSVLAIDTP